MLTPGPLDVGNSSHASNPFGVSFASVLGFVGGVGVLLTTLASIASLFVRWRRATGEERQQLRLLAFVGVVGFVCFWLSGAPPPISGIAWVVFLVSVLIGIPAAVAIAVLKYRLYDIDLVINKTIVFGALAAFIGAVYVAVVVPGRGDRRDDDEPGPVDRGDGDRRAAVRARARARAAVANRFVYGERATPYEVLSRFSERMAEHVRHRGRPAAHGPGDRRGHGRRARRRLAARRRHAHARGAWPAADRTAAPVAMAGRGAAGVPGRRRRTVPVRHGDELLGAVTVTRPRGRGADAGRGIAAGQTSPGRRASCWRTSRLTAELQTRLDEIARRSQELRASRQRIVTTQDAERRRLERNIHDGAQQHLVALAVKLRLVRGMLSKDPARAAAMLGELGAEVDEAIETLSSLALGIYPPVLEERGIAAALESQVRRRLDPRRRRRRRRGPPADRDGGRRVLLLLWRRSRTRRSTRVRRRSTIAFRERNGALEFSVTDDGVGFLADDHHRGTGIQGMRDRMAVLGGDAEIDSTPGEGTTVRGRIPMAQAVPA